ncbi:Arc family DNA binding domain-containing protein [Gluconobacter wancherniae]|uniref:Arc-like DNA binding domain-containing protein n=1 Tax=Gluconobacter wancherniae NBRC 103581 TaxID=656744 RepID=A0A511AY80_9PROT|nr:Arc family DNA binding domain-containing protein [Gluconobacter wancherniae]MBF0853325.1 Arc family DNA binding domain-containing protein [Gluconobacter wancherniae]GBD55942.1 hypothetical protein NBRC103581_00514 [Gluconobacter wancherniae NBRC 103581]GBR65845.1 hypothetical protein AA103581_2037 [Gluconobacter wancherniae NBRC 103581]GEK93154.1 hypothetical protein GWA01_09240 [Gluconobacter wancherniae NBRC 103581]
MKQTSSLTLRIDSDLLRALKIRAIMNDRSANGELSAILKEVLKTKKTEEAMLAGQTSSVSE